VLSALWLSAFTSGGDADTIVGVVILEIFTLVPVLYAAVHARGLTKLISDSDRLTADEQASVALALSKTDEMLWRLRQLVESLEPGPLREGGDEALRQARGIVRLRGQLVRRINQLDSVEDLLDAQAAGGAVHLSADACRRELAEVDRVLDDLAGSVARLVNAAEAGPVRDELAEVGEAIERVVALAEAMTELESPSG
jgi:hypothetical protein